MVHDVEAALKSGSYGARSASLGAVPENVVLLLFLEYGGSKTFPALNLYLKNSALNNCRKSNNTIVIRV